MNIWLGVLAVLAAYLCVSVGRRWWTKAARARALKHAWKREWSSGPRGASVVLPEIQQLRKIGLSGALIHERHTPAHRWLLATARQVVAQLAFFRKAGPEKPEVGTHEPENHSA
ncbi:MAG: hypothetical protein ACREIC_31760 [Limisphaerales bacterium]